MEIITHQKFREALRVVDQYYKQSGITKTDVEKAICETFNLSIEQILERSRKRSVVDARQVWQAILYKCLRMTASSVGEVTGGYDHTTVLNSVQVVKDLQETSQVYRERLDIVMRRIGFTIEILYEN
ncbi:helix-turn-helix domain-containing protein [Terrimonas rubra]|uniref:Helix-turn-helix domain-containing protein n=1 Tax=Terrimonas rubra TaxID=1035890 RepID=A0ABW6ABE0_9BACT